VANDTFYRRDGSTSFAPRTLVRVGRCRGLSLTCRSIRAAENSCHDRFRQSTRRYVSSEGQVPGAIFTTTNAGTTWSRVLTPGVARVFWPRVNTGSGERHLLSSTPVNRFQLLSQRLVAVPGRATTPWRTVRIPRTSNVANRHAQLFAIVSSNTFVMSEGEPAGAVSTAVFRFQNPATPESRGVTSTTLRWTRIRSTGYL